MKRVVLAVLAPIFACGIGWTCSIGNRSERYAALEAGHVAQNILLQALTLGLGATPVGAFNDTKVQSVLGLPANHAPLYLIPIGTPES